MLAVKSGASHRRAKSQHGIQRRNCPVSTECEVNSIVQKCSEGICRLGSDRADAPLSPSPVVNGMIRLHRSNHSQIGEALKILRRHVLCVLNTPAPVAAAICFLDILKNIEDG